MQVRGFERDNTLCGRPLQFGNTEQIKAVHKLRAEAERREEIQCKENAGETREYEITVMATATQTIYVTAVDEQHAEEQALGKADDCFDNFEYEIVAIQPCKQGKGGL